MKTTAAILILIANLWSLTSGLTFDLTSDTPLRSLFEADGTGGGITLEQDPPDDGEPIFNPPPR